MVLDCDRAREGEQKMIQLTIIVPHYNSPELLCKLLDTIPNNNEIQTIVIDDKSNKYIEEFNSLISTPKYDHVLFLSNSTKNKGAGTCRNIGLDKAIGKWVLFADTDDYFCGDFYSIIKEYFNTDNDVVFFTPTSAELNTGFPSDRHKPFVKIINEYLGKKDEKSETMLRYRFISPWSKLIRKSFLVEKNIYFDKVIAANDVLFSTKLGFNMKKFEATQKVIYCITKSKGTLTTSISKDIFDTRLSVYINYCKYLRSNLEKTELKYLELNGRKFVILAIINRLGLSLILWTIKELKRNDIKIISLKSLNPIYLIERLRYHYKNTKYFSK